MVIQDLDYVFITLDTECKGYIGECFLIIAMNFQISLFFDFVVWSYVILSFPPTVCTYHGILLSKLSILLAFPNLMCPLLKGQKLFIIILLFLTEWIELKEFDEEIYHDESLDIEHLEAAIETVCGPDSQGRCKREFFPDLAKELERRHVMVQQIRCISLSLFLTFQLSLSENLNFNLNFHSVFCPITIQYLNKFIGVLNFS